MGDLEDELDLVLSTKILSVVMLESLQILLAKFSVIPLIVSPSVFLKFSLR
jgi:hypothetical protein